MTPLRYGTLIVILLATLLLRLELVKPQAAAAPGSLAGVPAVVDSWSSENIPLDAAVLTGAGVDDYLNRYYRTDGRLVSLYVGYYSNQRPGHAIHSPMNCMPGAGWQPVKTERLELVNGPTSHLRSINKVVIEKSGERQLVLYWYQTTDRIVASEYWSKFYLVTDAFQSGRTDVALVRIVTPLDAQDPHGEAAALKLALPFAERILPAVDRQLFQS